VIPIFRRKSEYQFLIAGEGSYADRLRELARGAENIRFLGHQSAAELQRLYAEAIAIIVPSLCYEVFGLSTIESFAAATPAIVHRLGALEEIVDESGGGLAYESMDELEFAIERLAQDQSLQMELGRKAHAAYLERWTPEAHLASYLDLIDRLRKR